MFEEATELIEDRLFTNWVTTPIDYDNVEYTPVRGTAFVRLQIEWATTNLVSVGGRARGVGYVELSIFVPNNTGTRTVTRLADDLAVLYNRWRSGAIEFMAATTVRVGQQEEWYQLKVRVPFKYDECYITP